jgi:tRNA(fMet)-specific endonuclease VapC
MICLDSTLIIDFLNRDLNAQKVLQKYHNEGVFITEIAVFEVAKGVIYSSMNQKIKKEDYDNFLNFISSFNILPCLGQFSLEAAKISSLLLKKGKPIDDNDCLTIAIMKKNNIKKIITRNVKHFSNIEGIEVISY